MNQKPLFFFINNNFFNDFFVYYNKWTIFVEQILRNDFFGFTSSPSSYLQSGEEIMV